ncbi:MAG TPA: hypothetical protein VMB78_07940 [Dissulfurispiraceae bacterium]|nr:hypothetical protein [Dissulfurispiraceae bacterium]
MENEGRLNNLKKHIFYEILDMAERVMVLVRYSPDVVIGSRGFMGDEKETGIILVFNPGMRFDWDEYGLSATLVFGSAPQKCFIPAASIAAVYSPDINVQFVAGGPEHQAKEPGQSTAGIGNAQTALKNGMRTEAAEKNIINVDFVHKKKLEEDERSQGD